MIAQGAAYQYESKPLKAGKKGYEQTVTDDSRVMETSADLEISRIEKQRQLERVEGFEI